MAEDFDSGKYDEYIVPEKGSGNVYRFKHDVVVEHLKKNSHDRDSKMNFANGREFIRLPIELAENEKRS